MKPRSVTSSAAELDEATVCHKLGRCIGAVARDDSSGFAECPRLWPLHPHRRDLQPGERQYPLSCYGRRHSPVPRGSRGRTHRRNTPASGIRAHRSVEGWLHSKASNESSPWRCRPIARDGPQAPRTARSQTRWPTGHPLPRQCSGTLQVLRHAGIDSSAHLGQQLWIPRFSSTRSCGRQRC